VLDESISKDNSFTYNLGEGESAEIIGDITDEEGNIVPSSAINVERTTDGIEITTDYSYSDEGFGEDYLTDEITNIPINIAKLGLLAENSTLEIKLVYQDNLITSLENKIWIISENETNVTEEILLPENKSINLIRDIDALRLKSGGNISINLSEYFQNAQEYGFNVDNLSASFDGDIITIFVDEGFRGSRKSRIIAYREDKSQMLESNEFNILVSGGAVKIDSARSSIKLGEDVKWTLNVSLEMAENVSIQLPLSADNISVSKIEDSSEVEINPEIKIIIDGQEEIISQPAVLDESQSHSILSGDVVADVKLKKRDSIILTFIRNLIKLTGLAVDSDLVLNGVVDGSIIVNIDENSTSYVVEYTTPAPIAFEEDTSFGKQVVISAADELGYTDVLSFTNIPEVFNVGQENKIKIFWKENNSYVPFDAYDLDDNGKMDYVEWITPHLSNQTFEIILITKAEHLDANRNFVEDVYDSVKSLDNSTFSVPSGDYLRVTFEQNMTLGKDMTVYAKVNCNNSIVIDGKNVPCEIYYKKLRLEELRRLS
jgi:hypothetical protein